MGRCAAACVAAGAEGPVVWVRGAYWDWCRLLERQQAREGQWWWRCVTFLCDVLLAITFDKTASAVVGCVHEVNQQQGGSNEH